MRKRPGRGSKDALSIVVAADWAPIRALEPVVSRAPEAVYGDLLPILRGADLRIVNCECALTSARRPVWKSGAVFKGLPRHAAGLAAVPFEVACLANNHVFDYGLAGFRETLDVLRGSGIRTVGAGLSLDEAIAPLTVTVRGTRVTILNFGEGEDLTASRGGPGVCGWEIEKIAALVRTAKKRGDFVVVVAARGPRIHPLPAALRRRGLPGPVRCRSRLRHRPPSPCPPGDRDAPGPAHRLQPGKLRLLPALRPLSPENGLLRRDPNPGEQPGVLQDPSLQDLGEWPGLARRARGRGISQ